MFIHECRRKVTGANWNWNVGSVGMLFEEKMISQNSYLIKKKTKKIVFCVLRTTKDEHLGIEQMNMSSEQASCRMNGQRSSEKKNF